MFVCYFTVGWCSGESARASNPSQVTQFGNRHDCQRLTHSGWQILRDYFTLWKFDSWSMLIKTWHTPLGCHCSMLKRVRRSYRDHGSERKEKKEREKDVINLRINAVLVWITEILLIFLFITIKFNFKKMLFCLVFSNKSKLKLLLLGMKSHSHSQPIKMWRMDKYQKISKLKVNPHLLCCTEIPHFTLCHCQLDIFNFKKNKNTTTKSVHSKENSTYYMFSD